MLCLNLQDLFYTFKHIHILEQYLVYYVKFFCKKTVNWN